MVGLSRSRTYDTGFRNPVRWLPGRTVILPFHTRTGPQEFATHAAAE